MNYIENWAWVQRFKHQQKKEVKTSSPYDKDDWDNWNPDQEF